MGAMAVIVVCMDRAVYEIITGNKGSSGIIGQFNKYSKIFISDTRIHNSHNRSASRRFTPGTRNFNRLVVPLVNIVWIVWKGAYPKRRDIPTGGADPWISGRYPVVRLGVLDQRVPI